MEGSTGTTAGRVLSAAAFADKPFSLSKPHYDQSTFLGRYWHFKDMSDPRCLAPGVFFGMSLQESFDLIHSFKATKELPPGATNHTMWLARKIYTSAYHTDTGEKIPEPFRMCGFAVFNSPIILGMLVPNPTFRAVAGWQGLNQTHNACVNYANRNASQPTPVSAMVRGYLGALGSSVGIAMGLGEAVRRAPLSPGVKAVVARFVPYPAVAAASTCNMFLMRMGELSSGINVKSLDGDDLGPSQEAAKVAIKQTALTRVTLPAPLLILPPVVMLTLDRATPLLRRFPRARLPVEGTVCFLAFVYGLPFALSLFSQEVTIATADLEERFHGLRDKDGQPITTVVFNKGL